MKEQGEKENIPSYQDFYVNTGLYTKIEIPLTDYQEMYNLVFARSPLDCFCISCSMKSIFTFKSISPSAPQHSNYPPPPFSSYSTTKSVIDGGITPPPLDKYYFKEYQCSWNAKHNLVFYLLIDKASVCKIGQFPSLADVSIPVNKEYQKILGIYYSELNKAIGLHAHGVGVGAFVYLRRIIENFIINPAYEEAKQKSNWNEDKYIKSRVGERIKLLKDCLPSFLVENAVIYSILSKGIHELSEKECLKYFPVLMSCLEVILTDLETKRQQDQKRQNMQAELSKISTGISGDSTH